MAVELIEKYDKIQAEADQNGSSDLCWELNPTQYGSLRKLEIKPKAGQYQRNDPQSFESHRRACSRYGSIRKVKNQTENDQNGHFYTNYSSKWWKVETQTKEEQVQLDLTKYYPDGSIRKVENQTEEDQIQLFFTNYDSIKKAQDTQTKEGQVQLDPTKYYPDGSIRKVKTQTKEDQVQLDCNKYGAIRKVVDTQRKEEQSQLDSISSSNAAAANNLKSGPQVLIKNINGKLTITPVPGTGTENAAEMVQQQQQQTPAVESIPHKNSSLLQNKYGAIRKEQVQIDPTQYGAIRKVLNTKTKKDQNQRNCNQYGFIRNVVVFLYGMFPKFSVFSSRPSESS